MIKKIGGGGCFYNLTNPPQKIKKREGGLWKHNSLLERKDRGCSLDSYTSMILW